MKFDFGMLCQGSGAGTVVCKGEIGYDGGEFPQVNPRRRRSERMKLEGTVAVVTGASRGIGRVVARRCAAEGAKVALVARSAGELELVRKAICEEGRAALDLPADVTREHELSAALGKVRDQWGEIDLLVNVAGRLDSIGPAWEADPESWWQDVTVNILGTFRACREVLPPMIERGRGRIINFAGGGAQGPFTHASGYGCAKAAVTRFTETLAEEIGEDGPKVFALSPGFVKTEMTEQFLESEQGRRWMRSLAERLASGDHVPPGQAAQIVADLAGGSYDALHGRYIHAGKDYGRLAELAQEAAGEDAGDLRRLRISGA
ncbi:MAG: SDR family NAD(P)-dependent oxidoreductase [Candidatus Eisenbacteria bacterium]|nr:SDR family NAD(P)-dependent oxidoreductase [Candidatus Eisenbacteria bacterium]